jgi:hypothetical protein
MIIERIKIGVSKPRSGDMILSCLRHFFQSHKSLFYNHIMPLAFLILFNETTPKKPNSLIFNFFTPSP